MSGSKIERRYPIGAELIGADRVHFRVWAPKAQRLAVSLDGELHELERDGNRYFGGSAKGG